MAGLINIFSLYKVSIFSENDFEYLLLWTKRPSYPNYNEQLVELSFKIENDKRNFLLQKYFNTYNINEVKNIELIGKLEDFAYGSIYEYKETSLCAIPVIYANTNYGFPWIVLGIFDNIEDFINEFESDDDCNTMTISGKPYKVHATLITENNFDLSCIKYFDILDLKHIDTNKS